LQRDASHACVPPVARILLKPLHPTRRKGARTQGVRPAAGGCTGNTEQVHVGRVFQIRYCNRLALADRKC
ncbi:MAG TPA: hypothetical protein VJQ82_01465, partial [Terriglobales bacterium]|nr:hypothetical protein [Terriglobales bacterium]